MLQRIRIAALGLSLWAPVAYAGDAPATAPRVTASAEYQRFRRVLVRVATPADLSGKSVEVRDGDRVLKTETIAPGDENDVTTTLVLPMPAPEHPYGPLAVAVDGKVVQTVNLPDLKAAHRQALTDAPFHFDPPCFSGTKFPRAEFEDPSLVEDAIGPYAVETTFYDAGYNPVKSPATPGRYGAIVDVKSEDGAFSRRIYATLYRQPEAMHWRTSRFSADHVELPKELGIDPGIADEQPGVEKDLLRSALLTALQRDDNAAINLAWLSEAKPGTPKATQRTGPSGTDQKWWAGLKKKLGLPTYNYLAFTPDDYATSGDKKYPLIVFLHGSGERGDDLQKVATHGPPKILAHRADYAFAKDFPFVVVSPQCPDHEWWNPYELNDLLDTVVAKYRIDPDRIYFTGLSLGGFGTYAYGIAFPGRVAALAPICGIGDVDDVARIKPIPTWVFHGDQDPAVPFEEDVKTVATLQSMHGRVQFKVYKGLGHDVWTPTYANPQLYEWFLKQKRGAPAQPPAE